MNTTKKIVDSSGCDLTPASCPLCERPDPRYLLPNCKLNVASKQKRQRGEAGITLSHKVNSARRLSDIRPLIQWALLKSSPVHFDELMAHAGNFDIALPDRAPEALTAAAS